MTNGEKSTKNIYERFVEFSKLNGATILQVDATVIVGALFFLTLSSFLGATEVNAKIANLNLALMTGAAILPLSASGVIILYQEAQIEEAFSKTTNPPSTSPN